MSRLEKRLDDWISHNFIATEQAQKIIDYEAAQPSHSWVFRGFLILGAITIGIGIISLVAANWKDIPDPWKLSVDFVLLVALAVGAYRKRNQPTVFEILLVIFVILCLASIGLISQIYHTGGKFYEALLLGSVITSGVVVMARRSFVPSLWATGFFFGIILMLIDLSRYLAVSFVPLLSACLALVCMRMGGRGQTKAFISWTVGAGVIALITVELYPVVNDKFINLNVMELLPTYVLAALLIWGVWRGFRCKKIQKRLLWLILIFYLVSIHFPLFDVQSQFAFATASIAVLVTVTMFVASLKWHNLFQFFLILLGLRFLILYFQALGGLALTGVGLIAFGMMIIFTVVIWNKYRRQITAWAEGVVE